MASQAVQLWVVALQQIKQLPEVSIPVAKGSKQQQQQQPAAAGSSSESMATHLADNYLPAVDDFLQLSTLNTATWTKLIIDCKIPLQLGQLASAASASDPLAPKATAAATALSQLFYKAATDGVLPAMPGQGPTSVTKHIGQQLKQSGVLPALPRLLAAAATALTDTLHDPILADVPHSLTVIRHSSPAAWQAIPAFARQVLGFQDLSAWLLQLATTCLHVWPQLVDRAAVAVPALRLCAAVMQHCSSCAELIPADTADPPTALEQHMLTAFTSGQAVCAAWNPLAGEDFDVAVLESPDAMRTICMLLLLPILCPRESFQDSPNLLSSIEMRNKHQNQLLSDMKQRSTTSVEIWQAACSFASGLSAAQQQALQELECSGKMFILMAENVLNPMMNTNTVLAMSNVYMLMASHSTPSMQLDKPDEVRKLAKALSASREAAAGGTTSSLRVHGASPMLPCAALFWLMPAVLLQWSATQSASGPHFAYLCCTFSSLLLPSLEEVMAQHDSWAQAEEKLFKAAGGMQGRQEEQQAMLNAVRAMFLGGGMAFAPIVPASMQNLTPEQAGQAHRDRTMYKAAAKAAAECRNAWTPPAACLAQLLHLAGNASARIMACMQAAAPDASGVTPPGAEAGSSSTSSSSNNTGSSTTTTSSSRPRRKARFRSGRYGDVSPVASGSSAAVILSTALFRLSYTMSLTLELSVRSLCSIVDKDALTQRHDTFSGMERYGIYRSADGAVVEDPGHLDSQQEASLASLCAALQHDLPQLVSLVEASVRMSFAAGEEPNSLIASVGGRFLQLLQRPGVALAGGIKPGSPAAKPLVSLSFTLLKLAGRIHASPGSDAEDARMAARCLEVVLQCAALFLKVACHSATGSGSSSRASSASDVVITVLTSSPDDQGFHWSVEGLNKISSACSSTTAPCGLSHSSSDVGAAAVLPWLVILGRCCLGYVALMRQAAAAAAAAAASGGQQASTAEQALHSVEIMMPVLLEAIAVLPGWLKRSSVSAELTAAGYVVEPVLEVLQTKALKQAAQAAPAVLAKQLQGLGLALTSIPIASVCNNPQCTALAAELSEQQLVVGSSRRCSGCRVARYCSKAPCQKAHWKQHRPACKAMAAAAAAAAESASTTESVKE